MKLPIEHREAEFQEMGQKVWETKLTGGTLDIFKPKRSTLAQWIGELERAAGALRFHPAWGRACSNLPAGAFKALVLLLALSLAIPAGARSIQYPPTQEAPAAAPGGDSSHSNVIPITLIAGAVLTTGYILFRVHKKHVKARNTEIRYTLALTNR